MQPLSALQTVSTQPFAATCDATSNLGVRRPLFNSSLLGRSQQQGAGSWPAGSVPVLMT